MKTLYYIVEKELDGIVDDFEETTVNVAKAFPF